MSPICHAPNIQKNFSKLCLAETCLQSQVRLGISMELLQKTEGMELLQKNQSMELLQKNQRTRDDTRVEGFRNSEIEESQ